MEHTRRASLAKILMLLIRWMVGRAKRNPQQTCEDKRQELSELMRQEEQTMTKQAIRMRRAMLTSSKQKQEQSKRDMPTTKRRCYIRDDQYAWLPATILGDNQQDEQLLVDGRQRVKVRVDLPSDWLENTVSDKTDFYALNKKKKWVSNDNVIPTDTFWSGVTAATVHDLSTVRQMTEASILYLIKNRYARRQYYTRMGDVMIAMNPHRDCPDLYSTVLRRKYAKSFVWQVDESGDSTTLLENIATENNNNGVAPCRLARSTSLTSSTFAQSYDRLELEPHLYEVSATAYRRLILQDANQTILVSGISGSGKSDTVQHLLEHLVTMDASSTNDKTTTVQGKIHKAMLDHVLSSSMLLEAFGNAATSLNANSTRYGKSVKLHFALQKNGLYGSVGSQTEVFLLESSRVVDRESGGGNFHIFYHLLALPSQEKFQLLGPTWMDLTPNDFAYLHSGEGDHLSSNYDVKRATKVLEILEDFQCNCLELKHLVQALAVVLLLGNLTFEHDSDEVLCIKEQHLLESLSELMGIESKVIEDNLTTISTSVHQEIFSKDQDSESARVARDALAKTLYSCIVDTVVRAINTHTASGLQSDQKYGVVSLVDTFGFERLERSRFEQLMVNYTCETIRQKYRADHLKSLKAEYDKEDIDILSCFESYELSSLILGKTDFLSDMVSNQLELSSDENSQPSASIAPPSAFSICLYRGPLQYDLSNFERISLTVPDQLLELGAKSSNAIIAAEFCELVRSRCCDDSTNPTAIKAIEAQVNLLAEAAEDGQVQHIWCIKPNASKFPYLVDQTMTLLQLQNADLSAAITFSSKGFPNKLALTYVSERFKCLLNEKQKRAVSRMESSDVAHFVLSTVVAQAVQEIPTSSTPFACGRTKAYFRSGVLEALEAHRGSILGSKAATIQRFARRTNTLTQHRKKRDCIVLIQSLVRCAVLRSSFRRQRNSVKQIQKVVRKRILHQRIPRSGEEPSDYKAIMDKKREIKISNCAATKIAAWYRSRQAVRHYFFVLRRVSHIQKSVRRRAAQWNCLRIENVSTLLSDTDIIVSRKQPREDLASTSISQWYRSESALDSVLLSRQAAVAIQAKARTFKAKKDVEKRVAAAEVISRFCGRRIQFQRQSRRVNAATTVCAWYRSIALMRMNHSERLSIMTTLAESSADFASPSATHSLLQQQHFVASVLAAWYRGRTSRMRYLSLRETVIGIQAIARMRVLRRTYHRQKAANRAAIQLQALWRSRRERDSYLIMKGATVFLESWVLKCVIPCIRWNKENAVILLQAWVRGRRQRRAFTDGQKAVKAIQSKVRQRQVRNKLESSSFQTDVSRATPLGSKETNLYRGIDSPTEASSSEDSKCSPPLQNLYVNAAQDLVVDRLMREIETYKYDIAVLQSEVAQVTEFASQQAQEMEAEFEEKLSVYEDEVLNLKQDLIKMVSENAELKSSMEKAERRYQNDIHAMQKGFKKAQLSHRDYLDKIMALLDDTEVARKTETDRIREELDTLKRDRDSKIAGLKEEILFLRNFSLGTSKSSNIASGSLTQGAKKLAQKLRVALSPDNILLVTNEAQAHTGPSNRYIEAKLSSQAVKHVSYLEEMIQIADIEASKQAEMAREARNRIAELETQLTRAYQEYGRLQSTATRRRRDFLE